MSEEFWLSDYMDVIDWESVKIEQDYIKAYLERLESYRDG